MASLPNETIWQASKVLAHALIANGCGFASCYPGSPTTMITDELESLSGSGLVAFRYGTNEKVALEMAAAYAFAGGNAAAIMKHVGLNVALDSAMGVAYTGQRGAFVLVVGDDPSCESSSCEQDSRLLARALGVPCIEPGRIDEIPHAVALATRLSRDTGSMVMLRVTTLLCQSSGPIAYEKVAAPAPTPTLAPPFGERRFILLPAISRENRVHAMERLAAATRLGGTNREFWDETPPAGEPDGVAFVVQNSLSEPFRLACRRLGIDPPVWRTRLGWPLAGESILPFLARYPEVIVVEEAEPLLEEQAIVVAHRHRLPTRIRGADLFPRHGRLDPERIANVVRGLVGQPEGATAPVPAPVRSLALVPLPPRPPTFCAGCPHTASFYAIKGALTACEERVFVASDIGCYTLGTKTGIEVGDVVLCMGASIGLATGTALLGRPSVALIGDSTFVHAGLPALRNAVEQRVDLLVCILDNGVAAMTGGQKTATDLAAMCFAMGATSVEVVDPFDPAATQASFLRLLRAPGVSVLIATSPCALTVPDRRRRPRLAIDACTGCGDCVTRIHCPAISLSLERKFQVDVDVCVGCGLCSSICPEGALTPEPLPE